MKINLLDDFYFAICFIDYQIIYFRDVDMLIEMRLILLSIYNTKNKKRLKSLISEFKMMQKELSILEAEAFKNYFQLFSNNKIHTKEQISLIMKPQSFNQYFILILKSASLFLETELEEFNSVNKIIAHTDLKELNKIDPIL